MKDAIVIGAGWAGVIAARDLSEAGLDVQVLEARDRVGGRVSWGQLDPDLDLEVEWGGTYMPFGEENTPLMRATLERYGRETEMTNEPPTQYWWLGQRIIEGGLPVGFEQIPELEKLLYCMARDAHRLSADHWPGEEVSDLDISAVEWMERNGIEGDVNEVWLALNTLFMGGPPADVSMLHILWWVALMDHSLWKQYTAPTAKIKHGAQTAIEAIVDRDAIDVRFNSPVRSITQHDDRVVLTLDSGEALEAKRVVVATPSNVWEDLDISPALSAPKERLTSDGHIGISTKFWALVRNCPDFVGVGWGIAAQWLKVEYTLPEGRVVVGFGVHGLDKGEDVEAFKNAILTYAPDAEIVKVWGHDWVNDPYAKGAWCAYRAGQMTEIGESMRTPEGRLYFATSDIARHFNGWMEGAIEAGAEAGAALAADLKAEGSDAAPGQLSNVSA